MKNVSSVNPIPVSAPMTNPFSFPFMPVTMPPISNDIIPIVNDKYDNINSVMFIKRIKIDKKVLDSKINTKIVIQP